MPKSKARTTAPGVREKRSEAFFQNANHVNGHSHPLTNGRIALSPPQPPPAATNAPQPSTDISMSAAASIKNDSIAEKIKELVHLANEQGHLTFCDIHEALPNGLASPEDLEEIHHKLPPHR